MRHRADTVAMLHRDALCLPRIVSLGLAIRGPGGEPFASLTVSGPIELLPKERIDSTLAAMERELLTLGDVCVVAPATEQSGVGHSITFLSPLICKEVYDGERRRGWAVEGSPADCVKLGIF